MLAAISTQLLALTLAAIANILMGVYHHVNDIGDKFSIQTLIVGVIKAIIIIVTFITLAYCFDVTDLSSLGMSPDLVINAAIVLYVGKALQNLAAIMGVSSVISKNSAVESTNNNIIDIDNDELPQEETDYVESTNNKIKNKNFNDSVG